MTNKRIALSVGTVVALMTSSVAVSAEATRAADSLPTVSSAHGTRAALKLKKKSKLQETTTEAAVASGSVPAGTYIIAGIGLVVVAGTIYTVVDNNDSTADSPG